MHGDNKVRINFSDNLGSFPRTNSKVPSNRNHQNINRSHFIYQVIRKWLSYREKPLLGRGLTPEEVRYVTEMARRLTVLVALQLSLDDNYRNGIRKRHEK